MHTIQCREPNRGPSFSLVRQRRGAGKSAAKCKGGKKKKEQDHPEATFMGLDVKVRGAGLKEELRGVQERQMLLPCDGKKIM